MTDVERVVAVVELAGLARRVAQLFPLGVVKGSRGSVPTVMLGREHVRD